MGFVDYKRDLCTPNFRVERVLDIYFHSGSVECFGGAGALPDEEANFKEDVIRQLDDVLKGFYVRTHPLNLVICGSGKLGFSPAPIKKFGRAFDPNTSDIDVAIIHPELFEKCWQELQNQEINNKSTAQRLWKNTFAGYIDPGFCKTWSTIAKGVWDSLDVIDTDRADHVRGRIYKDAWSMELYHRKTILGGKAKVEDRIV